MRQQNVRASNADCKFIQILNPTIPIYISELARPSERARLVGIFGLLIAIGFCLANWIGYACSFASGDGKLYPCCSFFDNVNQYV